MFVSLGYFAFWCIMRGAHVARPSALHRGYVNIWLFTLAWAVLVVVTVFEDRFDIAAGYPFVFLQSALFLTAVTSLLELFALPNMKTYGQQLRDDHETHDHLEQVPSSDAIITPGPDEVDSAESDEAVSVQEVTVTPELANIPDNPEDQESDVQSDTKRLLIEKIIHHRSSPRQPEIYS